MKKYFVILCILFIALVTACNKQEKYAAIPKGATVLVLGDSLSYGTGAKEGEDYPTLLAKKTGWTIINAGVAGDTSAAGLERLPVLLTEYQPQLLIVELGGNDLLHQLPQSETEANLKAILSLAKAQNIKTILVAIPEINALRAVMGKLTDHPMYALIAKETATPLIKAIFSDVLSDRSLKADQVHPNAAGYAEVGNKMHQALTDLGFQVKN
ncbi:MULTISPECIES: GDSL-type esterase/lipase family protein [Methylotenera]|uniref:GDSL-type esterase/lipase family protein n=1 Tax=Methylotenera TaxID=359407 RepID=UPI00037C8548|nr:MULTISPECIES: GDSL-type esterase/lipase family protein [Methylotenera]